MGILTSALDSLFVVRDILHTNIARANDPTATTQEVRVSTQIAAGKATGLKVSPPEIYMNDELTSSIQAYQAKFGYDQTLFDKLKQLDPILGKVNSPSSFSALISRYESALRNFAAQPDNQGLRGNLIGIAQELTTRFNDFEKKIQDLRGACEKDIATAVEKTIENLNNVLDKNQMIRDAKAQGDTNPIAMNQRRGFLDEISFAIPIRVTTNPDFSVSVFGPQGNLIDGKVLPISFKQSSGMNAAFSYPGNLEGLEINNVDVTNLFNKSNPSQISALFELRDKILLNLSQAINQLSSNIKEEINAIHNNGAGYPGALSLNGTRNIVGTDAFLGTGSFRIATLNNHGTIQQVTDINVDGLADVNAAIAAINAGLAGTATAAIVNGKFNIQAHNGLSVAINENTSQVIEPNIKIELFDQNGTSLGVNNFATAGGLATVVANMNASFGTNAAARLDNGKIHITALHDNQIKMNDYPKQEGITIRSKGFSGYFGLNDFFQGETDPLSPSLAGSIKVNQALSTNPALISSSTLSLTAIATERGLTPLGIKRGDGLTPSEAMRDVLSGQFLFHATGDMGSKNGSIMEYGGSILTNITSSIAISEKNQNTSKTILSTSVRAFEKLSKQDLSQSAQKLAELQVSLNFILQALAQEQQTDMGVANKLAARAA